ncbi:predicted protein [Paecilomyces variotii No. 5]|uniref:Uncharacterized protein n=1 Tax=Byssochlamys spectabilis (strain No. 5 / NBRC 109023) TaxID=1356009 RepID=V5GAS2_BYSSN|nr:predicted protein [Paecilomyces variotii No. 5]
MGISLTTSTASATSRNTSLSSELALVDEHPPAEFRGIKALKEAISTKEKQLDAGSQDQYLSFRHVTVDDFARLKGEESRSAAFFYLSDIETLVRMQAQVFQMGTGFDEFIAIGATAITGRNGSEKEADSAWQNERLRAHKDNWPNIVIEAGLGESLARLRKEAQWWIEHSAGDVLVVLLVWVEPACKRVKIEKWVPDDAARSLLNWPLVSPVKVADVTIDQSSASVCHGAPLRLEFERVFGRPAQNAMERDIVLTQSDLEDWAELLWIGC